jgi:aspartate carbamoyltransferase catalytic subunit
LSLGSELEEDELSSTMMHDKSTKTAKSFISASKNLHIKGKSEAPMVQAVNCKRRK